MADFNLIEIEKEVQAYWKKNKIYAKLKDRNKKDKDFYFLDGPPYTSGRIHIGQAWNKAMKDMVLRYKRMNCLNVWDRAGYDMHGLPTENKVQTKLNIQFKEDIPKFGIKKFVEECRKLALENMQFMNEDFKRLGVWMDFDNAYKPVDHSFIEGEWWLIKKAHEKDRLYEGEKVMHWCGSCSTALAKHELEYETVTDDSVFLKFKIQGTSNEYLIIWTTTPWTIAFNLGIMVNPENDYVKVKVDDEIWFVAKALLNVLVSGLLGKKYEILDEFKGEVLEGTPYEHPFYDELKEHYDKLKQDSPKVHTVLLSTEYVDTSSGSGLVHCAPGCGPEDYEVGKKYGIEPFNELDENGNYKTGMGKFSGWNAKKDNKTFIEEFKQLGVLLESTPVEHEYAHCWRCHNPVVFRTTKQWFFKIEDLKEKMKELNKKVLWVPDWAGSNWFESWLDNLRDNGITRQRYWGTPLPIWKCEKCGKYDVIGSIEELKRLAGKLPEDLHIPYIDDITLPCDCGSTKKREPDILDVWIDAGTASWNCLDFPKEEDLFNRLFPADFILEGKDQIRGWFNLLLIASMIGFDKHSYKAVYMHGFVQDSQGRKMSKSLGNVISPYEVIDKYGADALRYYMVGGSNPGVDINYNFDDLNVKNRNIMVLWNVHKFLIDLCKNNKIKPDENKIYELEGSLEERYIISKLNSTLKHVTKLYEEYKLNEIPWKIEELYLALSRTYIQLIRDKAAIGSKEDKKIVAHAIFEVLFNCIKMLAPIMPHLTEKIYLNLKDAFGFKEESIHLLGWPSYGERSIDAELEYNIDLSLNVVQSILAAREKSSYGVRWPLRRANIVTKEEKAVEAIEQMYELIGKQTNVKNINIQETMHGIKMVVKPNFKELGKDFGQDTPKVIAKLADESDKALMGHIEKDGKALLKIDGKEYEIRKEHVIVDREVPPGFIETEFRYGLVYLDTHMDDELEAEGYSREMMRRIQNLRKKAGLEKADMISLYIKTDDEMVEALKMHEKLIAEKVGAKHLNISTTDPAKEHPEHSKEKVKGKVFEIFLEKL